MITITKVGKLPEARVLNASCRRCGTKFTFHSTDIEKEFFQDRSCSSYVVCPLCKHEITVPSRLL